MNNQILIFDIKSKFASFRKIDSNSSSMTYRFPPKTTIIGIIAAIMGMDKDAYYDVFRKSKIAVRIINPNRTLFQAVNNVKILNRRDLEDLNFFQNPKKAEPTIVPTELLIPIDFKESLRYRIYFSDENYLLEQIFKKLNNNLTEFPISLGFANMLAHANIISKGVFNKIETNDKNFEIVTPISVEFIDHIEITNCNGTKSPKILKDLIPYYVEEGRHFKTRIYVFEESGLPINVKVKPFNEVFSVSYEVNGRSISENICLL